MSKVSFLGKLNQDLLPETGKGIRGKKCEDDSILTPLKVLLYIYCPKTALLSGFLLQAVRFDKLFKS